VRQNLLLALGGITINSGTSLNATAMRLVLRVWANMLGRFVRPGREEE
jgi:hypothetical protein